MLSKRLQTGIAEFKAYKPTEEVKMILAKKIYTKDEKRLRMAGNES